MNYIGKRIYSHLSLEDGERNYNKEITKSEAYEVDSFENLVCLVAKITFNNPEMNIYYRGQTSDVRGKDNKTVIYPTLYRGSLAERNGNIKKLEIATEELTDIFHNEKIEGYKKMNKFPVVAWSVLQHYEVCETPLLDVTDSLRVACSFALSNEEDGFLYLLGLPHSNGSVTYSTEHELFNIKLNAICPPDALRAYYQSGYLIGCFPDQPVKSGKLRQNFGKRLVAKFKLDFDNFWSNDFQPIPNSALFPQSTDNKIQEVTHNLKVKLLEETLKQIKQSEKRDSLMENLYDRELKSEVLNLYMNDWDKDEIIDHLLKRGYSSEDLEYEYEEIVDVM